ncbi:MULTISPECIES: hypothetical protein [Rhizobium/Agrobacterium group]|uniref:hypothetical protein n=1 Tax=Rhizobium/Agrobacterium group TaxID=227290 RepID=UPI00115974E9|nr:MULTISPECIES: hypothetical protein [Rhizobium/Agrobacterium group]CAD7042223.1 hypothetical protein RP007_00852 [Rhizobium sp. P007]
MTAITKELMTRARDAAGKVLYAQTRGEDIAHVIARAFTDEIISARQDGIDAAIAEFERKAAEPYETKYQLGVECNENGAPLFQTDGPISMTVYELRRLIIDFLVAQGYDPRHETYAQFARRAA